MIDPEDVRDVVGDLWAMHRDEVGQHDRVYDYLHGLRGVPEVPEGAGAELKDLARDSVKNVCGIVVDAFAQSLAVNGFRSPEAEANDPAWAWWQRERLDARQQDAIRPAVAYGSSYAALSPEGAVRLRTPRTMFAAYADPLADLWPIYALETWIWSDGRKRYRRGRLYDETHEYLVDLGELPKSDGGQHDRRVANTQAPRVAALIDEPIPHGFGVTPVARFINKRDAEAVVRGEVQPLFRAQRSLNAVNFDRLVVARFGAFPQRYAIGWAPDDAGTLARVAMDRLMAFEDDTVKVGAFPAASVDGYNSIIEEMLVHIAMEAQIPTSAFGSMVNLSAEALAMAEAPYQRKLAEKRESFGETWEQLIRLAAQGQGVAVDDAAEVTWRDTETRSFAQVVDGIVKLSTAGVPIEELVAEIPGWTKTRADQAVAAIKRANGRGILAMIDNLGTGTPAAPAEQSEAAALREKFDALGIAVRSGVDPEAAASLLGLDGLAFTGAVPVTLRVPQADAAALEAN